jgi:hypothetical protein
VVYWPARNHLISSKLGGATKPYYIIIICCVCNKVLGGSIEQTHQFEYIELYVEINLSIPARIGV